MPASSPPTAAGCSVRPLLVAHRRRELDDDLDDRPGAEAEQERRERPVERRGADPGAEDRGRARPPGRAARAAPPSAARARSARRSPAPRSCCAARSRRRGTRRARAPRPRRRSRSRRPRRGCAGRCRSRRACASGAAARRLRAAAALQPRRHAGQQQVGRRARRRSTSAGPPNACEPSAASSMPSSVASIGRNASSPIVTAISDPQPRRRDRAAPTAATASRARSG